MGSALLLSRPFYALAAAVALLIPAVAGANEVIREQDSAGRVRVIREVTEDAMGNCVNHGLWQARDPDGRLAAEGRYEVGLRTGVWRRWLAASDIPPACASQLVGFELPLTSQAEYLNGVMVGPWSIIDAAGRPCVSVELDRGQRHGVACWWSPTGEIVRRETYKRGRLEGEAFARSESTGMLEHSATWVNGFHLVRSVAYYQGPEAVRRSEGDFLLGPQFATTRDDFWETHFAEYGVGQECIPHGVWTHWHPGGQVAAQGRYAWGRPVGEFMWRHANGQKSAVGCYADDGHPTGSWRWWNADGAQISAVSLIEATGQPASGILRTAGRPPVQAAGSRQ